MKKLTEDELNLLFAICKAMGHKNRMDILNFLATQTECYFGDIHEELPIAKSTVSQHLKELKNAGLIQGTIFLPKVKYCINRENWRKAQQLFNDFFNSLTEENGKTTCCN